MSELDLQSVAAAVRRVLPPEMPRVALHEPEFAGREWEYVKDCLDSGWVSSVGSYVDRFEQQLAEFTGAGRAVAVANGTAALHVALILAGVEPGDEVLLPALTFIATANAVSYCHAVPHFADVEERTLGVDPEKLAAYLDDIGERRGGVFVNRHTRRAIRALIVMHSFGQPVDLDPVLELCARTGITLIEDAAESLGTYYKGRHTGSFGRIGTLSFNGNKIVTTGGGGAVLTQDAALGARAKHITTTAKVPHRWAYAHDEVAFNYRLPNLNAALGCAQLEQLPRFLAAKRALAEAYERELAPVAGVRFFRELPFAHSNYWLNVVLLDREHAAHRDELLALTNDSGIMTRPAWTPMHQLPMYSAAPRMDLSATEDLHARLINVPSSAALVRDPQPVAVRV
ncbi:MAG TPA: LegC family aminotransferase [Thermoanaerobaculia bacterium]|nr:LegC family aminotransferase [Thermoanaerobaculia bacterium]